MQQTDKKGNDRYFTNQEEFKILKDNIEAYFSYPKRSQDRKRINTETTEQLEKLNPGRWNDKLVRVWFTNNKDRILSENDPSAQPDQQDISIPNPNSINLPINSQYTIIPDKGQTLSQFANNQPIPQTTSNLSQLQSQQQQSLQQLPPPLTQQLPISTIIPQYQSQAAAQQVPPSENQNAYASDYAYPYSSGDIPGFTIPPNASYDQEINKNNSAHQNDSYIQAKPENDNQQIYSKTASVERNDNNSTKYVIPNNDQSEDEEEDNKSDEDKDDELPEPPNFDHDITGGKLDSIKYDMYDKFLPSCYRYYKKLKGVKDPKIRLEKQEKLEDRFVKTLENFIEAGDVKVVFSKDVTTMFIYSRNTRQIRRTFSVTTQRYNNEPVDTDSTSNNSDLTEGYPFIFYSKNFNPPKLNAALRSFYFGKYEEGNRSITILSNIETATFIPSTGDALSVVFNYEDRYHQLVLGEANAEVQTGFFLPATSIVVHDNTVWIQGDVRVRAFDLDSFQCVDTLYVRKEFINKSAITIWNGNVAIGVDDKIYLYSMTHPENVNKEDTNFRKKFEDVPRRLGIEVSSVDWTHGRKCRKQICDDRIQKITSMITVDDYLIVASEDYPVIHIYGPNETILARLVGHTMGITSLHSSDSASFYSGSKDYTLKRWKLSDFTAETSFLRHCDDVTAITTATYYDHSFMFSGSKDARINVWDLTYKRSTFQVNVTDNFYPVSMLFSPSTSTLSIIAVQKKESNNSMMDFYKNFNENNQDQIQTFTFSKE